MNATPPAAASAYPRPIVLVLVLVLVLDPLAGCSTPPPPAAGPELDAGARVTAENHPFFPITAAPHNIDCTPCHDTDTFRAFNCTQANCHPCETVGARHASLGAAYTCESLRCYECHPKGIWP